MKTFLILCLMTFTQSCLAAKSDNSIKPEVVSTSDMMSQEFVSFLVNFNLKNFHFNNKPKSELIEKAYLLEIDREKSFLLKPQVENLSLNILFKDVQKNLHAIASSSKKSVQRNVKKLTSSITNKVISFDDLNKPFTINLDRKTNDFFNTEEELISHWEKAFTLQVIKEYLREIRDDEISMIVPRLSDKDKDEYVLKNFKKDDAILQKVTENTRRLLLSGLNKQEIKTVDEYITDVFNGVASTYDIHSRYIPPKDEDSFTSDLAGNMEGIGAVLKEADGYIEVVEVVPGGSAWNSNQIESGDSFVSVTELRTKKENSLKNVSVEKAVTFIKGAKGTSLILKVKKKNTDKIVNVLLARVSIELASTYVKHSTIIVGKEKYGYILVPKFYRDFSNSEGRNCSSDVKKALAIFEKEKVNGVILDLRNNGGGALIDAQIMAGLFIEKGPIVKIKHSNGTIDSYDDLDPSVSHKGSLVVLVNKFSASASEIVAAALQDYKRAIVLGTDQTHGKGTVQSIINFSAKQFPLFNYFKNLAPNLGTIKITTQKFYRVSGETTQYNGVVPDIVIPESYDYSSSLESHQEFSLKPDTIIPSKIKPYMDNDDITLISKKSQERIDKNTMFSSIKKLREFNDSNSSKEKIDVTLENTFNKDKVVNENIIRLNKELLNFKEDYTIKTDLDLFYPNLKNNFKDKRLIELSQKEISKYDDSLKADITIAEALNIIRDLNQLKK